MDFVVNELQVMIGFVVNVFALDVLAPRLPHFALLLQAALQERVGSFSGSRIAVSPALRQHRHKQSSAQVRRLCVPTLFF